MPAMGAQTTTSRGVRSTAVVGVWAALLFAPMTILGHSEYHPAGAHLGWHFASLHADAVLYAWTRNRFAAWLSLYVLGGLLLTLARRRDPSGAKLDQLACSRPGLLLLPACLTVLLVSSAVCHPSEVMLLAMLLANGFFGLWALSSSGAALASAVARVTLLTVLLLTLACVGEWVMRRPAMVERTGGSLQMRLALRERSSPIPLRSQQTGLPWRTRHIGSAVPTGASRVLVLGDSFSFGDFVDSIDDLWPYVLEDALREGGHAAQVINTAIAGSDTAYQLGVLETLGWLYRPDVIVLQYTLNDVGSDATSSGAPLLPMFGTSLEAHSHLYASLNTMFKAAQAASLQPAGWSAAYADTSPGWKRSRDALREIVRQATARGVPVIVLLFPMFDSDLREAGYQNLAAHQAIASFLRRLGVPLLDIRAALAAIDPDPRAWWARPFDSHPSAAAHAVAGRAVAAELERRGLGRPPSSP